MRVITKFILIIPVGLTITILLSAVIPSSFWWNFPVPVPAYVIFSYVAMCLIVGAEYCRYRTNVIINELDHFSIRAEDIIYIPWEIDVEGGKTEVIGKLAVCMVGGLHFWEFSSPGKVHDPIWIFPAYLLGKEGRKFHCYANLDSYEFLETHKSIQGKLKLLNTIEAYEGRFDPEKTPLWVGYTGHLDGSNTPENLYKQRKDRDFDKEISTKDEIIKRLHIQIRDIKEDKEKTYYLGPGYKEVDRKEE